MTDRESDEMTLAFLALGAAGMTSGRIGERFNVRSERVRTATVRVAKDDIATGDVPDEFYGWLNDRRRRG